MEKPKPIRVPKRTAGRSQLAFDLSTDEERSLKERFHEMVGKRNLKPVLLEFMRRWVQLDGRVSIGSDLSDDAPGDPEAAPQSREEYVAVRDLLDAMRVGEKPEFTQFIVPEKHARYYSMLREILNGGNSDDIHGIAVNLSWGSMATKIAKGDAGESKAVSGSTNAQDISGTIDTLHRLAKRTEDRGPETPGTGKRTA